MVVLASEIGTPIQIKALKWHKHSDTSSDAQCENFSIYMGLCSSDQLSTGSFDGNYIDGTKTLVCSENPLTVNQADEWAEIVLDKSYWYNGTDNLIIEIQWQNSSHTNSYYNNEWFAGDGRCVYVQAGSSIASIPTLPQMILSGTLSLENSTFAEIKIKLGF